MPNTHNRASQSALLGYYEKVGRVSQLMVEAAAHADWSTLANAEIVCEQLICRIRTIGDPKATLDEVGRRRRLEILRSIIADDARIREITQPWVAEQVEPFLGARPRRARRG